MFARRGGRGGIDRGAGRGGAAGRRGSVSLGRVRAVVACPAVRRAGVSERAPGGGGEPRAARSASAPPAARPRAARRPPRARSLLHPPRGTAPKLTPVFLWARQLDGTVQEVRCEDYDPRNRIRIARTPAGWRVIPRTETYDAIRVSPRRRRRRRRRRAALPAPDLESHIPSHTIAVPRRPSPGPPPSPPAPAQPEPAPAALVSPEPEPEPAAAPASHEPTPLDKLLAVAELELSQQLPLEQPDYFLPPEEPPQQDMAYDLPQQETAYPPDEKDLFETISEANYLPELTGTHDEALLESLVEKTCEDNQVLGQALDNLASLVSGGDYVEEEEDMLLGGAPVADIIDRLEQLSPARNSMAAAQGLLHLHHVSEDNYSTPHHHVFHSLPDMVEHSSEPPNAPSDTPTDDFMDIAAENHVPDDIQNSFTEVPTEEQPHSPPDQSNIEGNLEAIKNEIEYELAETEKNVIDENAINGEGLTGDPTDSDKDSDSNGVELVATDLSIKHAEKIPKALVVSEIPKQEDIRMEEPKDFSVHKRLGTPASSPHRIEPPRAPSRESDAMQSPQPSGIPAVPSSPELFIAPSTKSKQQLYLETLLSSPSPKMYTSEVTITKQQCEPLNLGKHRKSASPTVSSCSDEIRKIHKEFGEPQEKRSRRGSTDTELAKISKVFTSKNCEDHPIETKTKRPEKPSQKPDENSPVKQFQILKSNPDFYLPDPLLVPKSKLQDILEAPGRELPALLIQRPELRLPDVFNYPLVLQDPDIVVLSLNQLETIIETEAKGKAAEKERMARILSQKEQNAPGKPDHASQNKRASSMDALAGDIDAATSALNQMLWLPYISQLEAAMACSQNLDFLKALSSSGYSSSNYPDLSQMFNPSSRFMGQPGFPMMQSMDYDNRLQFAMWQEAMNHSNSTSQRSKSTSSDTQAKDPPKTPDVQNPYVHSTKNSHSKTLSSARTSPIAHNYGSSCQQRANPMGHNPFLQGMYPGMSPTVRPNVPLPGLQIPYFNPNAMSSQRSPRSSQQKTPTSPYYHNNNYLQSLKHHEGHREQRSGSTSSQESPRPRISVKSLHNLLEPSASGSSSGSGRRASSSSSSSASIAAAGHLGWRRDEPEVGSTTPLGEPPPPLPPHPHDPVHLWHPLFGNQKGYSSPWSWTTVTATGD